MSKPNRHIVVDDKVVTIGIDDYRALKSIEAAFSTAVAGAHADAYAQFKKQLRLTDYFSLATSRARWIMQDRKGLQGQPAKQTAALVRYCDAAVAPLQRAFGDAALIKALPAAATEQRTIDICKGLGAKKLAMLCEHAQKAAK